MTASPSRAICPSSYYIWGRRGCGARSSANRNQNEQGHVASSRVTWPRKISQPRTEISGTSEKAYTPAGKIMMIAVCITAELDCIFSATARRQSKLYTGPNLLPRRSFDCLDVTDSLPAAGGAADSASVPQSSSFTQKHSIDRSDGPGTFFRSP